VRGPDEARTQPVAAGVAGNPTTSVVGGTSRWTGRRLKGVSKVSSDDHDDGAELVLTFEELAEAVKHAPPPTDDDVTVTWDGRVINTKEKLLAWLKEIDAERAAGLTFEQLEARAREHQERYGPAWTHLDWDWDPVTDPRV
jgi:hypothetical protein